MVTPEFVFVGIIALILFDFGFETVLSYLNHKSSLQPIPKEGEGIYDAETYAKQQAYTSESYKFEKLTSVFSLLVTLSFFLFDGFLWVHNWVVSVSDNAIFQALLFFGVLSFGSTLINLPFGYYSTFYIEEKFGFNKTTHRLFFMDLLKGLLLSAILGGVIGYALLFAYFELNDYFFWAAWGLVTAFSLLASMLYTNLIVPIFNKLTPLEEGELKSAIETYCNKVGFKLTNLFVIDGSKRSTKANAFFSGFGPSKKIVLYDTLVNNYSTQEIVAVLAHEVGHYKKKHTIQGLFIGIFTTGLTLYIFNYFAQSEVFSKALGANEYAFHLSVIVFGILYSPISLLIGLFGSILSRKNEFEADNYAKTTYHAEHLVSALKKLSSDSYSNLTPHPLYVFFNYSHPPVLQRIKALLKH